MAKKTKKTGARQLKTRPEPPVYTYRIIATGREPELVHCRSMNVYSGAVEFTRVIDSPEDPKGEEVTILAIPTRTFDRIELVGDAGVDALRWDPESGTWKP